MRLRTTVLTLSAAAMHIWEIQGVNGNDAFFWES
jgi:hypothetical protein